MQNYNWFITIILYTYFTNKYGPAYFSYFVQMIANALMMETNSTTIGMVIKSFTTTSAKW